MIPDFLVIGSLVLDVTDQGLRPGGTVWYAAHAALRLGVRTAVLTNTRPDWNVAASLPGADIQTVGRASTLFVNRSTPQGRQQHVRGHGALITPADVPLAWRNVPVVLLGPVLGEVAPAVLGAFPGSLVGVTPQGWLRQVDASGRVTPLQWDAAETVLPQAGATILSLEDVGGDEARLAAWAKRARLLVVTEGAGGCRVWQAGVPQRVPGFPARECDPTGAGDVFAAAFLVRLHECGDPVEAAVFANAVAACSVEAPGIAGIPTRAQVEQRRARAGR